MLRIALTVSTFVLFAVAARADDPAKELDKAIVTLDWGAGRSDGHDRIVILPDGTVLTGREDHRTSKFTVTRRAEMSKDALKDLLEFLKEKKIHDADQKTIDDSKGEGGGCVDWKKLVVRSDGKVKELNYSTMMWGKTNRDLLERLEAVTERIEKATKEATEKK